jgi:DNA-binding MarR family transcriptional regulator
MVRSTTATEPPQLVPRTKKTKVQYQAYLSIVQAAEDMRRDFAELFRAYDLSTPQYNVLRILRGAGPDGLMCSDVSSRLLTHDSDVTRLLDRLDRRGLIERARSTEDRRVVRAHITDVGLVLLASLDGPVDALHQRQLGHVSQARLIEVSTLLTDVRKQR